MASIRSRAPAASSEAIRKVMQSVPSRDTGPEVALRRKLHARGLRFRKDARPEPDIRCKADIVFTRARVCVFIDGCFWHGCPQHFTPPKTNTEWWLEKIEDNIRRDREKTRQLQETGWAILRFWEHELANSGIDVVTERVAQAVNAHH